MANLFWHLVPEHSADTGWYFELKVVEKITPYPKPLEPKIYLILLKRCVVQTEVELLPALLRGAIELEEHEIAAYTQKRMEKIYREFKQELN